MGKALHLLSASVGEVRSKQGVDTELKILILAPRFHGGSLDSAAVAHSPAQDPTELSDSDLLRVARNAGSKSRSAGAQWKWLTTAFAPAIAKNSDGKCIILSKIVLPDPDEVNATIDNLAHGHQGAIDREEFERYRLTDLNAAESDIAQSTEYPKKAEQRQPQQQLLGLVLGSVRQMQLHAVGGVVSLARQLMAIVPDASDIEIEATIENKDIGFVRGGQKAAVKLEVLPFTKYGLIAGRVITVSDDAVEQPGQNGEAPTFGYAARIRLEKDMMNIDGKDVRLSPGMAATVEVKTGVRGSWSLYCRQSSRWVMRQDRKDRKDSK
ncbi:HlyD family efflux transporter periplasmic adaptor subunit [Dongia sp.]|uniref:HlyD family efflux transporter periplasmic adaptor subunit n=1 Tax=Dongia sp. TaxID=1977262 RepID=UPI0035AE7030